MPARLGLIGSISGSARSLILFLLASFPTLGDKLGFMKLGNQRKATRGFG